VRKADHKKLQKVLVSSLSIILLDDFRGLSKASLSHQHT